MSEPWPYRRIATEEAHRRFEAHGVRGRLV